MKATAAERTRKQAEKRLARAEKLAARREAKNSGGHPSGVSGTTQPGASRG